MLNRRTGAAGLLLVALASGGAACGDDGDNYAGGTIDVVVGDNPTVTVMLHVGNQSFADDEVDIAIQLDGETIIDREFAVGNQHNWIPFRVTLPPGEHTLAATSSTGVEFSTSFEVADQDRYAVLNYWYYPPDTSGSTPVPRGFDFQIQNEPIGFA